MESASHKYGMFADSCLSFEVVLADGSLINASKVNKASVFSDFHTIPVIYHLCFPSGRER
jgi:FAD/FMN-containing dehydrogenase